MGFLLSHLVLGQAQVHRLHTQLHEGDNEQRPKSRGTVPWNKRQPLISFWNKERTKIICVHYW